MPALIAEAAAAVAPTVSGFGAADPEAKRRSSPIICAVYLETILAADSVPTYLQPDEWQTSYASAN